nr:hypothetical protein [Parasutterella excrementihominis]
MAEVSSDTIKPVLIIDQLIEKLREEISNGTLKGGLLYGRLNYRIGLELVGHPYAKLSESLRGWVLSKFAPGKEPTSKKYLSKKPSTYTKLEVF